MADSYLYGGNSPLPYPLTYLPTPLARIVLFMRSIFVQVLIKPNLMVQATTKRIHNLKSPSSKLSDQIRCYKPLISRQTVLLLRFPTGSSVPGSSGVRLSAQLITTMGAIVSLRSRQIVLSPRCFATPSHPFTAFHDQWFQ